MSNDAGTAVTNSYTYYFITNVFGDVLGILDSNGNLIVKYTYDAFGNTLELWSDGSTLAQLAITNNPFRYRGYFYDTETGLYYLNSRYYNPEWGRFISADDTAYLLSGNNLHTINLYAYCNNNPVMYFDDTGEEAIAVALKLAGTFIMIFGISVLIYDATHEQILGNAFIDAMNGIVTFVEDTVDDFGKKLHPQSNTNGTTDSFVDTSDNVFESKEQNDPNPYRRPGEKKQNRENRNKSRTKPGWESRNNRRDGKPAKPKSHTPGRDHRKYFSKEEPIKLF